jgi:hypothetical protein
MRTKYYLLVLVFLMVMDLSKAQNNRLEYSIDHAFRINLHDSSLITGFYFLTPYDIYEYQRTYRAEYTQHADDIMIKRPVQTKGRRIKGHYVYSTTKIVDATNPMADKFVRQIKNDGELYLVNPLPIATQENIIRVYNYNNFSNDSLNSLSGLTFKLNYCTDSLLCANNINDQRSCPVIGLIINNQLVALTQVYIKHDDGEQFLVFRWMGSIPAEARRLYYLMNQKTLILCHEQ